MIIPIRCFTCGKVISDSWEEFKEKTQEGNDLKKVLDELGIERYCCRRVFLSHVDLIDEISPYY